VSVAARSDQHKRARSQERSPLRPQDTFGPVPRPPDLQHGPPPSYKDQRDPPPLHLTKGYIGGFVVFLIIIVASAFFYYDLPFKVGEYNRATARMREQEGVMREEAKRMENERIALGNESNRLEKERLALDSSIREMEVERDALESAIRRSELERSRLERGKQLSESERHLLEQERERWEKAREDRVPQGAFWEDVWPVRNCRAYGKREYCGRLRNIPGDWTDMDACMNMPTEIKGVTIRRPHRCAYVKGSPHIHGYWMVDWDQPDCRPWHQDLTDKVYTGKPWSD